MALVSIGEALQAASTIFGLGALRGGLPPLAGAVPDSRRGDEADESGSLDTSAADEDLFEAVEAALKEAGYLPA